jgi:hypothetical protein
MITERIISISTFEERMHFRVSAYDSVVSCDVSVSVYKKLWQ